MLGSWGPPLFCHTPTEILAWQPTVEGNTNLLCGGSDSMLHATAAVVVDLMQLQMPMLRVARMENDVSST